MWAASPVITPGETGLRAGAETQTRKLLLLLLLFTAGLYARVVTYDFILDDFTLIALNPALDSWSDWHLAFTQHVWGAVEPPVEPRHYRPVHALWLLANKQMFGGIAPWWHLMSLLLHLSVIALLYCVALRLTNDPWTALLAAALFAVHPAHAEAVAWISAVPDLLVTLFLLAAFLSYLVWKESDKRLSGALSLAWFTLALLSKETAAIFPALLLGYEALQPPGKRRWRLVVPYMVMVAMLVLLRQAVLPSSPTAFASTRIGEALRGLPLVWVGYAKVLIAPFSLSFFYAAPRWTALAFAELLAVVVIIYVVGRYAREHAEARPALLWVAVFSLIPLAAIAVFTPDNWVHDRHMYLPSVGLCIALATWLRRSRTPRWLGPFAVVFLAMLLHAKLPRFHDELTLYRAALRRAPANLELRLAYAYALAFRGDHERARTEYLGIVSAFPGSAEAWANLGMDYEQQGQLAEARRTLARAAELARPESGLHIHLLFRLGEVENRTGELVAAERHLRQAIALRPDGWNYHATLADVLRKQGRRNEAAEEVKREEEARQRQIARRRL